jgi:hypothetical protein
MDEIEEIYEQFARDAEGKPQADASQGQPPKAWPMALMPSRRMPKFPIEIWFLLLAAMVIFLAGIRWGLPSGDADPYLFGNRTPWDGAQITELIGDAKPLRNLGADVDANPREAGAEPILLNASDADRAEIVRRYRLFSYQPDEMITLMSLAQMHPSRLELDPKLYQYGGLWIYPVAAMLKIASTFGLITLVPDTNHYLDHPEQFAGFYVTMRLYALLWGLAGVWAAYRIVQTSGAGRLASIVAALVFACLPVVVNLAHEAKPHLPGAVLILLAVLAAGAYARNGTRRWWIITSVLCGAAMGMVLTGAIALLMIPLLMLLPQRRSARQFLFRLAGAWGIGIAVYFLANPYVLMHLLGGGAVMSSNLGNSESMYHRIGSPLRSLATAALLLGEGASPLIAIAGLVCGIHLCWRGDDPRLVALRMLLAVAAVMLVPFILLAAGRPGEYGRFAVLPCIALALAVCAAIGRSKLRGFERVESLLLVLILAALPSAVYVGGFVADAGASTRRLSAARLLESTRSAGALTLGVFADPAPYALPPVNLFEWQIYKLPKSFDLASGQAPVAVIVRAGDTKVPDGTIVGAYEQISERRFADLFPSRISWANKPINIWVRKTMSQPATTRESEDGETR